MEGCSASRCLRSRLQALTYNLEPESQALNPIAGNETIGELMLVGDAKTDDSARKLLLDMHEMMRVAHEGSEGSGEGGGPGGGQKPRDERALEEEEQEEVRKQAVVSKEGGQAAAEGSKGKESSAQPLVTSSSS